MNGIEKSTIFTGLVKKNILHENSKTKCLKKVHMFVGEKAEYRPSSFPIDEEEDRLLHSVRNDDVMVLTKSPLPHVHNIRDGLEGRKLVNFLQNLVKNGAIFAYVT